MSGSRGGLVPRRERTRVVMVAVVVVLVVMLGWLLASLRIEWLAGARSSGSAAGGTDKSYTLPAAEVVLAPQRSGEVLVREAIDFSFSGSFSGAYRDVLLQDGIDAVDPYVCADASAAGTLPGISGGGESGAGGDPRCPAGTVAFTHGAPTALGSSGRPGSFGTERITRDGNRYLRIVWHYAPTYNALRTFTVGYTLRGVISRPGGGSADRVVMNVAVWGDEWKATLGVLTTYLAPPPGVDMSEVEAWSRAASAPTRIVEPGEDDAPLPPGEARPLLIATGVPPGEKVELFATLPAAGFDATSTTIPAEDAALSDEVARIEREADRAERGQERWADVSSSAWSLTAGASVLGLLLGGAWVTWTWRRVLREDPWPAEVPALLTEPPDDLPPALAAALVEQDPDPDNALVATVFDLVRRDHWESLPAAGGRGGASVDIALRVPDGERPTLQHTYEQHARDLVDEVVAGHEYGLATGQLRDAIRSDRALSQKVAKHDEKFRSALASEVRRHRWLDRTGGRLLWAPLLLAVVLGGLAVWAAFGLDGRLGRPGMALAALGAAIAVGMAAPLMAAGSARQVTVRWRRGARVRAAQWYAYRHHLEEHGDMQDERVASIEIWERHLVYAVAFGCAEDILEAVRPEAPAEASDAHSLARTSPLLLMDRSSLRSMSRGVSARAPSESSGGGGGGGGFGGGGGGGGGAW